MAEIGTSGNIENAPTIGYLSLEDALDLNLCMSFNLFDLENREPFNLFKIYFKQKISEGKLPIYT